MTDINAILDAIAPVLENIVDSKIKKAISNKPSSTSVLAKYAGTDSNGKQWVVYDGTDVKAPISWSTIEAAEGDRVSVTISNGRAVMDNNLSNPSAGVIGVEKVAMTAEEAKNDAVTAIQYSQQAYMAASDAQTSAESASAAAAAAAIAADDAKITADAVHGIAEQAQTDAVVAKTAADTAQTDADTAHIAADIAQSSADAATRHLSDVEQVVGTVNWIAEHGSYLLTPDPAPVAGKAYYTLSGGTYALTEDTAVDAHKQYYESDGEGGYVPVTSPAVADIGSYYERSGMTVTRVDNPQASSMGSYFNAYINESVQNLVDTHVWVDSNGLNVASENDETSGKTVTTGWRIGSVSELVKQGVSWFKLWVENNVAKLRLGRADQSHVILDSDSLDIEDSSGDSVASFGADGWQVGLDDESHMIGDYHSLQLIDKEGDTYFHVSDLRGTDGTVEIVQNVIGKLIIPGSTVDLYYTATDTNYTIDWIDDSGSASDPGAGITVEKYLGYIKFVYPGSDARVVTLDITFNTSSSNFKAFTFGCRDDAGRRVGPLSACFGNDNDAIGYCSFAAGDGSIAAGDSSFASGYMAQALGNCSHAEGSEVYAQSDCTHAGGRKSFARGDSSFAHGMHLVAQGIGQGVFGRYNEVDGMNQYAFIVGNGTADDGTLNPDSPVTGINLSNAFTVGWNGTAKSAAGIYFSQSSSCNYYWVGAQSGSYAYLTCVDYDTQDGIQYRFPATPQSTSPAIQFRNCEGGVWGEWTSWIWSSKTSRTANTVLAAPNGSAGAATFRKLVAADCSWIDRQLEDKDDNVSVANSTWVKIASITCPAGTWIISGTVYFASNSTGRRYACIHSASPTTAAQRQASSNCNAVSGAQTSLNVAGQKAPTSSTTYGLYAYQTSGSALNATGFLSAVRIK